VTRDVVTATRTAGPAAPIRFAGYDGIALSVADLAVACDAWRGALGWEPFATSGICARFALDDETITLRAGTDDSPAGTIVVRVRTDDLAGVAAALAARGVAVSRTATGALLVSRDAVTGVRLEVTEAAQSPGAPRHPHFRRINHVVVAVKDGDAALDRWAVTFGRWDGPPLESRARHHFPVGSRSWFGITPSGTDGAALRRFVERRGEGIYAVGFAVGDAAAARESLAALGARLISAPSGQTFVHPSTTHGLLLDIVDPSAPLIED
jgi:Glyoxalase/Bleomycin resistance protein/Dioxygenase superfamily